MFLICHHACVLCAKGIWAVRDNMDVVEEAEEVNSMGETFCIGDAEFIRHDPAVGVLVGLG